MATDSVKEEWKVLRVCHTPAVFAYTVKMHVVLTS